MAESTVSLKLLIDTTKVKRVLFAEADKDCVDFLFQILSLHHSPARRSGNARLIAQPLPKFRESQRRLYRAQKDQGHLSQAGGAGFHYFNPATGSHLSSSTDC